jgi:hypothetical protein
LTDYVINSNDHCPVQVAPGGEYEAEVYIGKKISDPYVKIECKGIVKGIPDPTFGMSGLLNFR